MTTEEYITSQPEELQPLLRKLVETIRTAAPTTVERYSYKMPCFYLGKTFLCGFCVFKKHIGFYPGGKPVSIFANRLITYKTSTGAIQFPLGQPIDDSLIADIVRWRVEHG